MRYIVLILLLVNLAFSTTSLTINGTSYDYPEVGDSNWGTNATNWATAVSSHLLQKTGGEFTLSAEVDFGSSYGLQSLYYKSTNASVSSTGVLRIGQADDICWRNNADDGDLCLSLSTDTLTFNSVIIPSVSDFTDTNSIDFSTSGSTVTADILKQDSSNIALTIDASGLKADLIDDTILDAQINSNAAISWSKISKTGSNLSDIATLDLQDYISGTANQIVVTDDLDNTITLSTPQSIATSSDVTFNSVSANVTGDVTGDVTFTNLTASKLLATGAGKVAESTDLNSWVAGTSDQISVADDGDGSITLSTPQSIATDSDVQFNSVSTDTISEVTGDNGVDIDSVKLKDGYVVGSKITNDSADVSLETTTSGDVNLDSVDNTVRVSSGADTSATTNQILFGDDTGGVTGIRNNSGQIEYNDGGAGWSSIASGVGANAALSNLGSVAINTSLVSDTDNTDDLGTDAIEWKDTWTHSIKHNDAVDIDLNISTEGNDGDIVITPNGSGDVKINTDGTENSVVQRELIQDYTVIGDVGDAAQQNAGHIFSTDELGSTDLALYLFANGDLLDDAEGTYDLTDNGTVTSTPGILGDTATDNAVDFNGTDQYYTDENATGLLDVVPAAIAIDFWMKADDGQPAATQRLMDKENVNGYDLISLYLNTSGKLVLQTEENNSGINSLTSNLTLPNGATDWHYVVVSWNTVNGKQIFIDKQLDNIDSEETTLMGNGTDNDFAIGAKGDGSQFFDGKISMFRVRNQVITQADVDAGYATRYALPSFAATTSDYFIFGLVRPFGDTDFPRQDRAWDEVARDANYIYRQGSIYDSTDTLRLIAR